MRVPRIVKILFFMLVAYAAVKHASILLKYHQGNKPTGFSLLGVVKEKNVVKVVIQNSSDSTLTASDLRVYTSGPCDPVEGFPVSPHTAKTIYYVCPEGAFLTVEGGGVSYRKRMEK